MRADLVAKTPERANLVARLPGRGEGPSLLYLSHTDTVVADPAEWSVSPWSGELRDGMVWGRGALDMKGQVAASAVAIASLAREGFRPRGDLLFAATADEEVGEDYGLSWLAREHPETVRADYALNEGSGDRLPVGGSVYYLCSTAEKAASPFRLRVRGRSGHGSLPGIADNALVKAAALVERLARYRPEPCHQPETEALLAAVAGAVPPAAEAVERAAAVHPTLGALVEPLLGLTLAPTMASASRQWNVVPAVCDVVVDCRLPPGQTQAQAEAAIREHLGPGDYELEWLEFEGGTRSPAAGPLWDATAAFVERIEPGAWLVPVCMSGFTDSHWLREAFGTVAYGFFPMRAMAAETASRLVHSADERVCVDDLELGLAFLRHAATAILSA